MAEFYSFRSQGGLGSANTASGLVSYETKAGLSPAVTLTLLLACASAAPIHRDGVDVRTIRTSGTASVAPLTIDNRELLDEMVKAFDILRSQRELDADVKEILYRRMDTLYL